ncbi:Protein of unknown function [Weissella confusa LBAE C39-2]|nr:Protein of unknown function [Weissella confusa LBAE C39-2]
MVALLG